MSERSLTAVKGPPFLMWYDDNPKISISMKIQAAIDAYRHRFGGVKPSLVLVNEAELVEINGVQVRGVHTVSKNTYWVGQSEPQVAAENEGKA
ncbi:MAG: hypothetical protein HC822_13345 [Oscillochloris sp.]|nr:hypothetical protein [Oscillochloris sp.]